MALLETVETRLLFRLTRFLAFVAILALSLALFIGAFRFADELIPNQSSEVTFNEISRELHPAPEAIQPGSSSSLGLTPRVHHRLIFRSLSSPISAPLSIGPLLCGKWKVSTLQNEPNIWVICLRS